MSLEVRAGKRDVRADRRSYAPRVRRQLYDRIRAYWWIWLLLGVAVAILNELFDRKVAGDKKGHPAGDVLVAIVVVLLVASVWETLANRRGAS
jgi:uncharacterized membrane protein YhaH (DUF805 family)